MGVMNENAEVEGGSIDRTDVVFECPVCGKSLAIDRRGAGLLIVCPDCREQIQVPIPPDDGSPTPSSIAVPQGESGEQLRMLLESLHKSQSRVQEVNDNFQETHQRRQRLEKMRSDHLNRFEKIASELALIQNAFDRIVTLIENAERDIPPDL